MSESKIVWRKYPEEKPYKDGVYNVTVITPPFDVVESKFMAFSDGGVFFLLQTTSCSPWYWLSLGLTDMWVLQHCSCPVPAEQRPCHQFI